jgi:hypothetical protein
MGSKWLAGDARERQEVMTKEAAETEIRGQSLRASGRRAKASADKLRAIPIKRADKKGERK